MKLRQRARTFAGLALTATAMALVACNRDNPTNDAIALTGGHPERGRQLIRYYGCGSCHTIPGVDGAEATVGPPLTGIARRAYVAGVLPNTPENLERWILAPQAVDPRTAMPATGVKPGDVNDIAAYLYTLR